MRSMNRLLTTLCAACTVGVGAGAVAQDKYPTKPVTMIVPQAPGGANDAVARILAAKLSEEMGQQFIVDNRPGAGGNIGTVAAARARPDGYTLLVTVSSAHVINPFLYKNAGFDPVKDFEPVALVATVAYLLVVNPSFPAKSVKELIDLAKAKPGDLQYASAGNGTLNHLLGEMLKTLAGIDMVHIPYKGAAASVTDVVGGRVPISFQSAPSSISFVKSGKLRVLGLANEKRVPTMPDVPTIGETVRGFGATPWYGVLAPAGTPKPIIAKLSAAIAKALDSKDLQHKMAAQGAEVAKSTPEQFAALIKEELPRWQKIVKTSGAQVD
jgi:tripartite-type tricarboxylate transporter receptor subunit TctC